VSGAVSRPLVAGAPPAPVRALPLSVAWVSGSFDPVREAFLDMLRNGLEAYARQDD